MPPRDMPFGNDTLVIPAFFRTPYNDEAFERWKQDHPDWFVAGHWDPPLRPKTGPPRLIPAASPRQPWDPKPNFDLGGGPARLSGTPGRRPTPPPDRQPGQNPNIPAGPGVVPDIPDPATDAQRLYLRNELIRAGELKPGDKLEAHHLVPQGSGNQSGNRDPTLSQQQLQQAGIDLGSAESGVALSPAFHRRIHTSE